MAARNIQISSITESVKALMKALDDEVLHPVDALRRKGWVTAGDYAKATNRSSRMAKLILESNDAIKKTRAKGRYGPVAMYKAK